MIPPPVLALHQVGLRFGGLQVLDAVDLVVAEHELLALIGPNGAGKTSLLNCINGVYRPSTGTIAFGERPIVGLPPHALARAGIGRTFQLIELVPEATVVENVLAGRHVHTRANWLQAFAFWGPAHREQARHLETAEAIIELLELQPYRARRAGELAQGVQRLVGLARALALEPRVLLLDEPSSGMSREEREDLARFLLRIRHERPMTMVWVEHDTQLVKDLADRIAVLHYGRKIADGQPDAVLGDPRVVEAYLGASSQVEKGATSLS
jgi:branched-chain amino acid transport system ATP-binding protein